MKSGALLKNYHVSFSLMLLVLCPELKIRKITLSGHRTSLLCPEVQCKPDFEIFTAEGVKFALTI